MKHIKFCCPVCGQTEIYKITRRIPWEWDDKFDYILCDNPEPGYYECIDGHKFEVERDEEFVDKNISIIDIL